MDEGRGNDLVAQLLVSFWDLYCYAANIDKPSIFAGLHAIHGGHSYHWWRHWARGVVCLQLVCYGGSMARGKPKRRDRRAFAFARDRIIIDANALVDWVGVAISDCPAALSH